MKILKYFTILSLIILINSCSLTKKVEKSIVGKWQVTDLRFEGDGEFSESFKKTVRDLLDGSYFEFKSDKTYEFLLSGKTVNGIWSVSEDGKKILSDGKDNFFEIISKAENKMTLKSFRKEKIIILMLSKT